MRAAKSRGDITRGIDDLLVFGELCGRDEIFPPRDGQRLGGGGWICEGR